MCAATIEQCAAHICLVGKKVGRSTQKCYPEPRSSFRGVTRTISTMPQDENRSKRICPLNFVKYLKSSSNSHRQIRSLKINLQLKLIRRCCLVSKLYSTVIEQPWTGLHLVQSAL